MSKSVSHIFLQLAQWGALFYLPAMLKPHWMQILSFWGGEKWANILGVAALHSLVMLIGNTYFYALYKLQIPSIEVYKAHQGSWPWLTGDKKKVEDFTRLCYQGLALTILNILLTVPLAWINYETSLKFGCSASLSSYPSTPLVVGQLMFFMLVEDTLFYWAHRTLHRPALYPYIHKVHHRFTHTVSIGAIATHPIEFVLGNVIPFSAGPLLAGAHLVTLYMWVILRIGETITNHSGYDLPWSMYELLPWQSVEAAHDAHHSVNTGNYASLFCWWDRLMGTEIPHGLVEAGLKEHAAGSGKRSAVKAD